MKQTSPHILNTSSNLLGLCFVVLTSVKLLKLENTTVIDELAEGCIFIFMTACILSFLSIRSHSSKAERYELIADYFFMGGLVLMFLTTFFITINLKF